MDEIESVLTDASLFEALRPFASRNALYKSPHGSANQCSHLITADIQCEFRQIHGYKNAGVQNNKTCIQMTNVANCGISNHLIDVTEYPHVLSKGTNCFKDMQSQFTSLIM